MGIHLMPPLYKLVIAPKKGTVILVPDVTTVDGYVYRNGNDEFWDDKHDGIGTQSYDTSDSMLVGWARWLPTRYSALGRAITLFDAFSGANPIPALATILSAALRIYGFQKSLFAGLDINVYKPSPASNTALVPGDYNLALWGTTPLSDTISNADFNDAGWNSFVLNAAGRSIVKAAVDGDGIIKLGFRCAADALDVAPGGLGYSNFFLQFYTAEEGVGFKPELEVKYQG